MHNNDQTYISILEEIIEFLLLGQTKIRNEKNI